MNRRRFMSDLFGSITLLTLGSPLRVFSQTITEDHISRARAILSRTPLLDLHTHPGMFALKNIPNSVNPRRYFGDAKVAERVAEMKSGQLGCGFIATVSDAPILRPPRKPGETFEGREWKTGESWIEYKRQQAVLDELVAEHGLVKVTTAAGIRAAHSEGKISVLYDCEGGDHLEGKPERLEEIHQDGVRVLQPIHIAQNGLGDIGGRPPVHNGLSDTGREVIREMNRLNMLIDMAHAAEETTIQAAELSTQPIISSHAILKWPQRSDISGFMSERHAQAVIRTGGVIGAFPGSLNKSFDGFIDNLIHLIEFAGVDHVGIGSDMDGNIKPVVDDYSVFPQIAASLLARGLDDNEVARVMGGNALRVMQAVMG